MPATDAKGVAGATRPRLLSRLRSPLPQASDPAPWERL